MNKLRIEKKDIYEIEVNDNGDTITFDLADIGLVARGYEAIEKVTKKMQEIEEKEQELIKNNADEKEFSDLETKIFKELREIMDSFLGKNACQKIFGDRNYYEMYDDLFVEMSKPQEELGGKSHFEMLDMTSDGIKRKLIAKYGKTKSNEVI